MQIDTINNIISIKKSIALCAIDAFALRSWKASAGAHRAYGYFYDRRQWPDKWLTPADMFERMNRDTQHGYTLLDFLFAAKTLHALGLLFTNGAGVYRPTMRGILWITRYDNGNAEFTDNPCYWTHA